MYRIDTSVFFFLSLRVFGLLSSPLLLFQLCGNNNKDEDNSPKTLNDKNHQASFRQLHFSYISLHQTKYSETLIALSYFRILHRHK